MILRRVNKDATHSRVIDEKGIGFVTLYLVAPGSAKIDKDVFLIQYALPLCGNAERCANPTVRTIRSNQIIGLDTMRVTCRAISDGGRYAHLILFKGEELGV